MSQKPVQLSLPGFETARADWRAQYEAQIGADRTLRNRSGIEVKPLYTPDDWSSEACGLCSYFIAAGMRTVICRKSMNRNVKTLISLRTV